MVRFTTALLAISALLSATAASPLPSDSSIDKRVTHTGRGTWFEVGLGACGFVDQDNDWIVAISHEIWGTGGNCNQYVTITSNGITRTARARDECMGCKSGDLDMSPSLFQQFNPLSAGVAQISWHFENKAFKPKA